MSNKNLGFFFYVIMSKFLEHLLYLDIALNKTLFLFLH